MSAQFIPLTNGPGLSLAYNISRLGNVVVGELPSGAGGIARRVSGNWKVSELPTFGAVNEPFSTATSVSSNNIVCGFSPKGNPTMDNAYLWTFGSTALTPLKMFSKDKTCIPFDVSGNGNIFVGYGCSERSYGFTANDPPHHALIWKGAGLSPNVIDPASVKLEEDVATRISNNGSVIVGFGVTPASKPILYDPLLHSRGHEPIIWRRDSSGAYHRGLLAGLNGFNNSGRALGINNQGNKVVGYVGVRAASVPVRWTLMGATSSLTPLANLAGYTSGRAAAISSNGGTIVGNCLRGPDANFEAEAFIWDSANGTRNLVDVLFAGGATNVMGWNLQEATGLSNDGLSICGHGWDPNGNYVAWVARL
jgi:uncharacterized membrane protein